jgi:hypothetical protein
MRARLERLHREIQRENPTWPVWKSPNHEGPRILWEADARRQ